jgi:hypothetical protein
MWSSVISTPQYEVAVNTSHEFYLQLPILNLNMTVKRKKKMAALSFMTTVLRMEIMCLSMMQIWMQSEQS